MQTALVIVAAYALGSISFAVVVSRLMRLPDPRSYGSKNPGATNVLRTGSRAAAALVLVGDTGKGWLAVWLASLFTAEIALAGLAAFVGHLFPVFHRFQGGKGVATAAGVLFALDWRVGACTIVAWGLTAALFRYSSLASLVAAACAPVAAALLIDLQTGVDVLAISALLFWRHQGNIARLAAGTEPRIGEKKPSSPGPSAA